MQQLLETGLVQDLDTDIPVQRSSYESADEVEHVSRDERTSHRHTLIGRVDGVLALVAVYVDAKKDVYPEDEGFGDQECFPEVVWAPHLGHELTVKHCPAVGEDCLHESQDLAAKSDARRSACTCYDLGDWWTDVDSVLTAMLVVSVRPNSRTLRWLRSLDLLRGCLVIRLTVSDRRHNEDHDYHVHPNGKVGDPTEPLQSSDLTKHHA